VNGLRQYRHINVPLSNVPLPDLPAFMIDLVHRLDVNGSMTIIETPLVDETATLAFGARLAAALEPNFDIWLQGGLGSGKTTLTRGMLRALGYDGPVKSPTYTLIEPYVISGLNLYHFDFYRLNSPEEFLDAGLEEYFSGTGACIVEWPQQAAPYLPDPDLVVTLVPHDGGRQARIQAKTGTGRVCVKRLTGSMAP
jgi:tRNA threonylcarbamoyladenosine biosynthesis protein TsaE